MLNKLKFNELVKLLLGIFIFSLFFPIRHVFYTNSSYLTGAYSDFTSFSLYLSDILLCCLILLLIFRLKKTFLSIFWSNIKGQMSIVLFIIWLILGIFWHFHSNTSLSWFFWLKYAELIVAYETIILLFSENFKEKPKITYFPWFFPIFASFQSLLALWQFIFQKSTGLWIFSKLGESILNPNILGVAKIVSNGTTYIRGYGTFPHPNLLAAFLVTSILISLYLILILSKKQRIFLFLLLFINFLGLCITFSRAGYLALAIGMVFFFGYLLFQLEYRKSKIFWITTSVCILYILGCFLIFRPFILTRATASDQATIEREVYNKIGIQMIKNNPIFGIGIGDSVLHMEQFDKNIVEPWQKQPIHNYFLLAAAELGIPGALILLWIFVSHIVTSRKFKVSSENKLLSTFNFLLATCLLCFFVLMMFDHYFYTLQQTQMLLWVILGIIATQIKTPSKERIDL
jgi:O-antigen ligase